MVWKIPYLNAGNSWGLNRKHDGMCAQHKRSEGPSEIYSFTDFATAGQDGFALVSFLACFRGRMQTQRSNWSFPHFLCQIPEFILQMLPLSKYAHSKSI
jgi:hypothetical protein